MRFSFYYNETPKSSPISPLVADIQKKLRENLSNDKDAKPDLEHDVTVLTRLLDAGSLDATDISAARYFRALAQHLLGVLRKRDGIGPDAATAEQALSEMDRIIAGKSDIPLWGISISEVEYEAGGIAWTELRDDSRAYSYWQRCADSAHAGCMVNLAGAYIAGWAGIPPDPAKALDLNLKVFETGTKYTCAGAHAAHDIANLIYFAGVSYPKDNDTVSWMQKSYALSDVIEARPGSKNRCDGSGARVEEFLYRLARGERQNELLTQATRYLGDDSAEAALINYFSGSLNVKAFEAAVESSKSDEVRCLAYFRAMLYAHLAGDRALVNKFYEPLTKFDQATCPYYLVYARKFHPEATQSQSIPTQHLQ